MNIETAEALAAIGDGLEVIADYSGRGMYGKAEAAVTGDNLGEFMAAMLNEAATLADADLPHIYTIRIDSMGRGFVVY